MGLLDSMHGLRSYLATAGLTGIDDDNVVIEDEGVFNKILLRDNKDYRRAIIIGYGGGDSPRDQASEFGGSLFNWEITMTAFILLWESQEARTESILDGYAFVDELMAAINAGNTLGGTAMDAKVIHADPPMLYNRQEMNNYIMLSFVIRVKENIYGEF